MSQVGIIYSVEIVGTFILFSLGQGVNANSILQGTKGERSWLKICFGWATAIFLASVISLNIGHLNPALTLGMWIIDPHQDPIMIIHRLIAQFIGTVLAQVVIIIKYWDYIRYEKDPEIILSCFASVPQSYNRKTSNTISILLSATIYFLVVYGVFIATHLSYNSSITQQVLQGKLDDSIDITMFIVIMFFTATCKSLSIFSLGVSLAGSVGFTINPYRDLVPRIAHSIWPIMHKGSSKWHYGWKPIILPIFPSLIIATIPHLLVQNGIISL